MSRTNQASKAAVNEMYFSLDADTAALGPTIADAFGTNSAIQTEQDAEYEIVFNIWYRKDTSGTVTWTVVNTQAFAAFDGFKLQSVAGGLAANGSPTGMGLTNTTSASQAFAATASLTDTTNQYTEIRVKCRTAAAGNIRLRVTSSAGTVILRRGSYFRVRRLPTTPLGAFVA